MRLDGETVWLSQSQMAELFQTTKQNISLHIHHVFEEKELDEAPTVKDYLTVQTEGTRSVSRNVTHYNLDVIISVGYRVKSHRGTQFRIWATQRLHEYLVKGFTLDDQRLAQGGQPSRYFDELLERVRAVRASERMFWQKVTDIYATSIDYDPHSPITQEFFATVQNKFHFAIHQQTAAEVILNRANADLPNMGLKTWKMPPLVQSAKQTSASPKTTSMKLNCANLTSSSISTCRSPNSRPSRKNPCTWPNGLPSCTIF